MIRFETFQGEPEFVAGSEISSISIGDTELIITTKQGKTIYSDFFAHSKNGDGEEAVKEIMKEIENE